MPDHAAHQRLGVSQHIAPEGTVQVGMLGNVHIRLRTTTSVVLKLTLSVMTAWPW